MITIEFDRIPPGAEVEPRRRDAASAIYLAAGEVVAEPQPGLLERLVVRTGDVLYETPAHAYLLRNEARSDALTLRARFDRGGDGSLAPVEPGPGDAPIWRRERARIVERRGMRQRVLVEPGEFGPARFKISEIELAPGATTGWHRHQRSEHVAVVFEGRGTVRMGSVEETLEPLRGVHVAMGMPHAISNTGRTPLRYYLCATPAPDPLSDREDLEPET